MCDCLFAVDLVMTVMLVCCCLYRVDFWFGGFWLYIWVCVRLLRYSS